MAATVDATFTWDYGKGQRPALEKLYERAKTGQWNGSTDLDWSTDVDPERTAMELGDRDARMKYVRRLMDEKGSPVASWGEREFQRYAVENLAHRASQFLHGEQGALLCTARIVETVPWIDAKYYASTQVMDEARHVEVFGRYLDEKLETRYPMNAHLGALIDDILADSRWDITYLGMQIMVEGLALAAFGSMYQTSTEPLLRKLLRYVMSDEARHVAFGVLSLQEAYADISGAELRERQEFVFEAAVRMRDRFLHQEVWERLGIAPRAIVPVLRAPADRGGRALPADAVRQDRPELQEARPARRPRRLAARPLHRARRDRVRGPRRHRRGVHRAQPGGMSSKTSRCSMAAMERSIIERVSAAPRSSAVSSVDVAITGYTNAHATLRR